MLDFVVHGHCHVIFILKFAWFPTQSPLLSTTKWNFKVNTEAGEKHERIITTFCLKRLRSEAQTDNELRVQYKKITSYEKLKIFLLTVFCTPALAQIEATFFNNNKCLLLTSSMSTQNVWSLEGFSFSQSNSRKIFLKLKSMEFTQKCKKGLSQSVVDSIQQLKTSAKN